MTNKNVDINVHYVTRVEGHGNIVVNIKEGKVEKCQWQVPEAPRFFEAMVVGRPWTEIHHITSRICGICSIGHTLASLKATEAAMGIKLSDQDIKLRRLALHAENLQSHILHLGYLVLPDLMGVGSVIPLASSHPAEVKIVVKLHKLANSMSDLVCGRTTHPQRLIPGGFTKIPTVEELKTLRANLDSVWGEIETVAKLIKSLAHKLPNFTRETEYVALTDSPCESFPLYDGVLGSTVAPNAPVAEYRKYTNEYCVKHSTAKYTKHAMESLMVGAIARVNKNFTKLSPKAKAIADMFGFKPVCSNPYFNNVAQLIEVVHSWEDSINIIDDLVKTGLTYVRPNITPKAGQGAGATEVPRGMLIHDYTYDAKGICTQANCIIPTNQNHANIQHDMEALVPQLIGKSKAEIELTLEMLVRAYDPCISCSTHYLKVDFVE